MEMRGDNQRGKLSIANWALEFITLEEKHTFR